MKSYRALLLVGVALAFCSSVYAATIHVPADQPTIQAGINAASAGDTVLVSAGIYYDALVYPQHQVAVVSSDGPEVTFLRKVGTPLSLVYAQYTDSGSVFEGFTIEGAYSASYPILVGHSGGVATKFEIRNCRFLLAAYGGSGGNVITCYENASAVIERNLIVGGGVAIVTLGANTEVINNTIDSSGYGLAVYGANSKVLNNIVVNVQYYAIRSTFLHPTAVVDYNDFWNNGSDNLPGPNGISADPKFIDTPSMNFLLKRVSPCRNAGDPNPIYNDPDGTRNDIGAYSFVNSPPSIPQPRLPLAEAIVSSQRPGLIIRNSTDAESDSLFYTFEVSPDNFATTVFTFTKKQDADTLTTLIVDSTLVENGQYWWRVKASDYYESSGYAPDRSFFVNSANTAPTAFALSGPDSGLTTPLTTLLPQFTWVSSSDPDPLDSVRYTLFIAVDQHFNFTKQIPDLTMTSYTLTDSLTWGTRYWWKVRANDLNGGSTWSTQVFTFRTLTLGDADGDGSVSIADLVFLINYIFMGGGAPQPVSLGDADCSGSINIADCVYLINYIFSHGPAPCEGSKLI
jgi:hypothetical protein